MADITKASKTTSEQTGSVKRALSLPADIGERAAKRLRVDDENGPTQSKLKKDKKRRKRKRKLSVVENAATGRMSSVEEEDITQSSSPPPLPLTVEEKRTFEGSPPCSQPEFVEGSSSSTMRTPRSTPPLVESKSASPVTLDGTELVGVAEKLSATTKVCYFSPCFQVAYASARCCPRIKPSSQLFFLRLLAKSASLSCISHMHSLPAGMLHVTIVSSIGSLPKFSNKVVVVPIPGLCSTRKPARIVVRSLLKLPSKSGP